MHRRNKDTYRYGKEGIHENKTAIDKRLGHTNKEEYCEKHHVECSSIWIGDIDTAKERSKEH